MIPAKIAGALILAIPLMLIAWIALRRQRPVRLFAVAMILVGIGYLMATGATDDIAHLVLGNPAAGPAAQPAN
ncbi:MAG: hypothetical protein AB7U75_15430 [Hyphomicrobiaceae bacterium]